MARQAKASPQAKSCIAKANTRLADVKSAVADTKSELIGVPDETLVWTPSFRRVIRTLEKMGRWIEDADADIAILKKKAGVQ